MIQITSSRGPNRPQSHLLVVFVELNGGDLPPLVVQAALCGVPATFELDVEEQCQPEGLGHHDHL